MLPNIYTYTVNTFIKNKCYKYKKYNYRLKNLVIQVQEEAYIKNTKKNLYESLSAYGVGFHRHNSEINQELKIYTKSKLNFVFTPHLTPMFKGILSTIYVNLKSGFSLKKIESNLKQFYKKNHFIKILKNDSLISTNDVINTNNCLISLCKTKFKDKIIILSAIDNLIKGGAGQAIQNMNIKFGFKKNEGLK